MAAMDVKNLIGCKKIPFSSIRSLAEQATRSIKVEWFLFDLKHNKLDCLSISIFALKRRGSV